MPETPIISVVSSGGVIVPVDVLEAIGLRVGDEVNVTVGERQLILRPAGDSARQQQIEAITRDVFERRKDAYERLA